MTVAASAVYRPAWARRNWFSRPPGGWHLVAATRRWHVYETWTIPFWIAEGVRAHRACDDVELDLPRLPRLIHGHDLCPRLGEIVCASCWREWERILALEDRGHGMLSSGDASAPHRDIL